MVVVCADDVGFADCSAFEDEVDGGVVIIDVNPVADLFPCAIKLGGAAGQDVGDLSGDEFFDVLVGPVVVGAVGDGCLEPEAADPCAHQVVAACLC